MQFFLSTHYLQVIKKERQELPKTVTITPSESTHFRVILSSEAMENETETGSRKDDDSGSVCTIVKPEPRTPVATVAPVNPLSPATSITPISTVTPIGPVMPPDPLDVLPANMATSTPSESLAAAAQLAGDMGDVCSKSDSPSKKKGNMASVHNSNMISQCLAISFWVRTLFKVHYLSRLIQVSQRGVSTRVLRIST